MKTKKLLKKIGFLVAIVTLFSISDLIAQSGRQGAGRSASGGNGGGGGENVPIDGGAALLLAAGAAYGIKKIKENRENNKETNIE